MVILRLIIFGAIIKKQNLRMCVIEGVSVNEPETSLRWVACRLANSVHVRLFIRGLSALPWVLHEIFTLMTLVGLCVECTSSHDLTLASSNTRYLVKQLDAARGVPERN